MAVKVKYFYLPGADGAAPKIETATDLDNPFDGVIGTEGYNPVLKFDESLIEEFQAISPTELGNSVPYVSLRIVDYSGDIIDDLSMNFFHAPVDMEKIKEGERYGERPIMSLKELELKTNLASGYLYYTLVVLRIKIHSPDFLKTSTATSFLIPGMPLLLEYGRKGNPPGSFLNQKETLLFQVKSYNLTMDTTGQVDLTVEGIALNETFNNVYVGDTGEALESENLKEDQSDSLKKMLDTQKKALQHMEEIKNKSKKGSNDFALVKKLQTSFVSTEDKIRNTPIGKQFFTLKDSLNSWPTTEQTFGRKNKKVEVIEFHNLVRIMCNDTFTAMAEVFPGVKKFNVAYGNFNSRAGAWAGRSIAEFPIAKTRFFKLLKDQKKNGQLVPTVSLFFNSLISSFFNNSGYWTFLLSEKEKEEHLDPSIVVYLDNKGDELTLHFLDTKADIPPTSGILPEGKAPESEVEKQVKDLGIPIMRLGHANSFIKSLSLSQITDQYMKAALIERMYKNRIDGPRSVESPPADSNESSGTTPLTLPLRGTASVLGHIAWKPFKTFYLAGGIYVVNGFYKITGVTHKLSAEGFNSSIDFIYH